MKRKEKILIDIPLVLLISMFVVMPLLPRILGGTIGFVVGILIYWFVFCIPAIYYYLKREKIELADLFVNGEKSKLNLLAFIPAIGTFILVFIPTIKVAPLMAIVIALVYALLNGFIEEVFWRGLYNHASHDKQFAFIYPTLMFAIWHIALYLAKGISFQGGFFIMVGGSALMGLIWGYVMYKTKSLKTVVLAHQLTNFFAFTGFIYINWFI